MIKRALTLLGVLGFAIAIAASASAGKPPDPAPSSSKTTTATSAATCADYGYYEHNKLDQCKKECTGNRKQCVKKQMCNGKPCPDPGYCWVCTKQ